MKTQLVFNNTQFNVTTHDDKIWLSSADIAKALDYASSKSITTIFNRNEDEFSSSMSQVIKLTTSGNYQKSVRIFSLCGAHLIAMFARTPIAKEFRKWVLDILDKEVGNKEIVVQKPITHILILTDDELCSLAWLWSYANYMRQDMESITPAIEAIRSEHAAHFLTMSNESKRTLNAARIILERETRHIQPHKFVLADTNWRRVLQQLRQIH